MSADAVYRNLSLESLSVSALNAQLRSAVGHQPECNAHVEFQLTPTAVEGAIPAQFALQIRLSCHGTPLRMDFNNRGDRLFELELRATAIYRQLGPESVSMADFTSWHTCFARQLFPALIFRAQELLERLGLPGIRLPLDLPQEMSQPQTSTPASALN